MSGRDREAERKATIPKEKARATWSEGEAKSQAERRRGSKSIKCPAETFRLFIKFPRLLHSVYTLFPSFRAVRRALCELSLLFIPSRVLSFANNYRVLAYFRGRRRELLLSAFCRSRALKYGTNTFVWSLVISRSVSCCAVLYGVYLSECLFVYTHYISLKRVKVAPSLMLVRIGHF